jgi:ATP-binding cassette subfamily G (WHITE) protein 2 (SNQ2)
MHPFFGDSTDQLFSFSVAIAFIAGSCFYNLPQTASGAFTRGGVLFIAMLFNSLQAFSELPGQMQGRPILYSQANKKFYRPGALSVAQTIADCECSLRGPCRNSFT